MNERLYHIVGWLLFVCSALGFIASSVRTGDMAGLIGSVLFLAGCVAFLIPLRRKASQRSRG